MNTSAEPKRVPESHAPKKRRSAASRVILSLFLLAVLGALLLGAALFYAYREYNVPGPLAADTVFLIDKGLSAPEIGAKLQDAGIISDARVFSAMAQLTGNRSRLKAGEYAFTAKSSMYDVMALVASGKSIVYKLSVPEGWTSDTAVARILANDILTGEVTAPPAEGTIMPDTYVFKRGMTRQKLIDDMQAAQTKMLDDIWAARKPVMAIKTKEEAMILASIVEKETAKADERPLIASVFINRLDRGMRLQSDPTIIYGITGGKGKLDHALTRTDIETPTPYNTYTINGLPPGPIANPGRPALEAVTNPPETSYLYFVADGTGGHAFASTLEEHNRNVAKWRKLSNGEASATVEPEVTPTPAPAPDAAAAPQPPPEDVPAIKTVPVPEPAVPAVEAPAAPVVDTPAVPEPPKKPDVEPAVKPVEPPPAKVEATPPKPATPKPGSVVKVKGKLTVIPLRKPKR